MEYFSLKSLKSGTDVRGIATGNNITLTDEAVTLIARAFIKWLSAKYNKNKFSVAVGNDSRTSAGRILNCVKQGILSSGSDIIYTGLSSTPSMFMLLKSGFGCDASIMITASHLPADRNGLKFFTSEGGLDGKDVDEILRIAESGVFLSGGGGYCEKSFMDGYSRMLVEKVRQSCGNDKPLRGKKIIVDAGNGAGGFFADKVLLPLGADISGSQFLQPDGNFPNHIPNPEDAGAIESLSKAVIKNKADLGIIFDTDVDRAGAVSSDGKEINRNRLIALLSAILLKDGAGVIVTDSVTSDGLTKFIEGLGGKHLRYKRGYKNVIDKSKELNDGGIYSPLAVETSGHAAFKENYFLDDGAYLVTKLLICVASLKAGQNLTDMIASLEEPAESAEVRITFNKDSRDFKAEGKAVIEDLKKLAASGKDITLAPDNYEGARIKFKKGAGDGWTLVRMSVHDPVMPVNLESRASGGNKKMAEKLFDILKAYTFLDITNLKNFITG